MSISEARVVSASGATRQFLQEFVAGDESAALDVFVTHAEQLHQCDSLLGLQLLLVGLNDHRGKAVLGDAKRLVEIQRCCMLFEVADRLDTHWQSLPRKQTEI